MPADIISLKEARRIALRSQGLADKRAPFGSGKQGALLAIEHLGYIQLDSISVIERAHYHALWSRVPDYAPDHLIALHDQDRAVFEYWSHAASYLPMRDYRYTLRRKRDFATGDGHWHDSSQELDDAMRRTLARLRKSGPLQLKDFESPKKKPKAGWGSHKIEKKALHELWIQGRVMIRERKGFQKVFDIPARVLPKDIDTRLPSHQETARHHILQSIRAHGLVSETDLVHLIKRAEAIHIREALKQLVSNCEIMPLKIRELPGAAFYASEESLTLGSPLKARHLRILSPFDNLVIRRKRLLQLFDFDYQLECYTPPAKRRHGYFSLPVLWGDNFVARIDAKADRAARKLIVQSWHLEPSFKSTSTFEAVLEKELMNFAKFNQCDSFRLPRARQT
jgi:uncharacterized protein YcaQ